jgi:hypothetical protein
MRYVRFEVFTSVVMKSTIFWDIPSNKIWSHVRRYHIKTSGRSAFCSPLDSMPHNIYAAGPK